MKGNALANAVPISTESPWPRLGLRPLALLALLASLLGVFLLSLSLGSVRIPLEQVLTIMLGGQPARATWATIIYDFRLPKALTAAMAGAALAVERPPDADAVSQPAG